MNSRISSVIMGAAEVIALLKRIVALIISLFFFITSAFAESGLSFRIENTAEAHIGETIEITGLLKNLSDTDMSGMTLKIFVENAEPLITASGDDRITIRKRSDSHVITDLKPGNEIPVTIQWTVPDSINRNSFTLAVFDQNSTETARCTVSYITDADSTKLSAAGMYELMIRMIIAVSVAAVITWLIVLVRKTKIKRG